MSNESLIDHDITTETSASFAALISVFSSCGVATTLLLFLGIYKDIKYLLIPWIVNMAVFIIVDLIYVIYGLIVNALEWNPSAAILVTVDFFLNALNLYALLCVTSQYQEYQAGRGTAMDDEILWVPNIQYSTTQPTATSFLSSHHRKPQPSHFDKPTPTHSPTGCTLNNPDALPLSNRGPRKSVKFDDTSDLVVIRLPVWTDKTTTPNKVVDSSPSLVCSQGNEGGTISV